MAGKSKAEQDLDQAEDFDDLDIDTSDYGFIVSADGELKTFFAPEDPHIVPPKEILKIFKIFKITNAEDILPKPWIH